MHCAVEDTTLKQVIQCVMTFSKMQVYTDCINIHIRLVSLTLESQGKCILKLWFLGQSIYF